MAQPAYNKDQDADPFDMKAGVDLEPRLINLMQQSEALVGLMRGFFEQLDRKRSDEFRVIAGYIQKAKEEIREMRPHDISRQRIPTAGAELDAITRDTEEATHTIMNCAEAIMSFDSADPKAYKAQVDDEVMKIFEACSFQDITGQRVSKVVNVLQQIEERVGRLARTLGIEDPDAHELSEDEIRRRDLLLNGPAIGGPETRQNDIDALFAADTPLPEKAEAPAPVVVAPAPAAQAPVAPAPVAAPAPEVVKVAAPAAPAPVVAKAPPAVAPAPVPPKPTPVAPTPAPQAAADDSKSNSQDDIDAMFGPGTDDDMAGLDMGKTNSQDDIDALFD